MRNAGIVEDRKAGLQVFYRLRVPCIMNFFDCVDMVMFTHFARPNDQIDTIHINAG
jgi:hypothetical protein